MGWPLNWTSLDKLDKEAFNTWHDSFIRQKSGAAIDSQNDALRNVWWENDPSEAPQGRQSAEQLIKQPYGSLPEVPYLDPHGDIGLGSRKDSARDVQDMQMPIQAEKKTQEHGLPKTGVQKSERHFVGRVAMGVTARVDRLKATGNGQVPIVAALAWRILSQ